MNIDFLSSTFFELLAAMPTTLSLVFFSLVLGFFLAIVLVLMNLSKSRVLNFTASGYIYYFRGTPLLIQMYLLYFGIGVWLAGFDFDKEGIVWLVLKEPYFYAITALMFNTAGYTAEILRGAIAVIPEGQFEGGKSLGMSSATIYRKIIFPQVFRLSLPAYSNEVILMVKGSSLASIITVTEMTGVMVKIRSETYAVYEVIAIAGLLYLSINASATYIFKKLEAKYKIPTN